MSFAAFNATVTLRLKHTSAMFGASFQALTINEHGAKGGITVDKTIFYEGMASGLFWLSDFPTADQP